MTLFLKLYTYLKDKLNVKYGNNARKEYILPLRQMISPNTSILSNNCFGGRISQDLGYTYNSPTAGLYLFYPDYIIFLQNLKNAIVAPITFVSVSKYPIANERRLKRTYPIGVIKLANGENIEIHFLHYSTEREAEQKWIRRCKRIKLDNILVIGTENDLCEVSDIKQFMLLNFENKVFFSANDYQIPNVIYIKEMSKMGSINGYDKAHILYKYWLNKK